MNPEVANFLRYAAGRGCALSPAQAARALAEASAPVMPAPWRYARRGATTPAAPLP
jgi:hypothetical protein